MTPFLARTLPSVLVALVSGWVLAGPAAAQPKEVVLGVIYPMTGPTAQAGIDNKPVFEIAADIANGAVDLPFPLYQRLKGMPGLKGAKVRLVFADHQGKPELGQSEAERMITQEKVHALVCCWHSGVTATASQVAERYGIPFMNPESSSPGLHRRGFKWFFRTSPHDEHFTEAMFLFFRDFEKKRGVQIKTLGLTYDNSLFGADSGKVMKDMAKKYGPEVVLDIQYKLQSTSLQAEVQRLKAANPDVWMPTSYQTDAILFVRTSKELDYNPKMIMAQDAGHIAPDFIQAAGKDAEGTLSRAPFSTDLIDKRPVAKALNAIYSKRHGKDLYDFPARAFTGMITLLDALNRAGSLAPEAIQKALVATNIPGDQLIMTWEGIKFDENGQNTLVKAIIVQLQAGKYYTVWPFDAATRDVIYPIPAWKDRK
ncbi:MAG: ABC transporter substrate-binding protein [Candidatus Rokubacteria bacterium]|nr:ABC transporter substrate-binding protein [Candidatus Rokubacteria bacterium]